MTINTDKVTIKFSLESRYIGSPGYVDFSIIIVQDDDEMVSGIYSTKNPEGKTFTSATDIAWQIE